MLGILQQSKELSITHFKDHNFEEFKVEKKTLRNIRLFSNFKHKINLDKQMPPTKFSTIFCIPSTVKKQ